MPAATSKGMRERSQSPGKIRTGEKSPQRIRKGSKLDDPTASKPASKPVSSGGGEKHPSQTRQKGRVNSTAVGDGELEEEKEEGLAELVSDESEQKVPRMLRYGE